METLTVYKTNRGRYAVRPAEWSVIFNKYGRIQEDGFNHIAIFENKENADFFVKAKEAEEQGKLLILPCKLGDTVYVISNYLNSKNNGYEVINAIVSNVRIKADGKTVSFTCKGRWKNRNPYCGNFTSNSIGKTVFLTEQEALKALEGMKK